MELADTPDSKSGWETSIGSSPISATRYHTRLRMRPIPFFSTKINKGLPRKIQGLLVPRKNYQNIFKYIKKVLDKSLERAYSSSYRD